MGQHCDNTEPGCDSRNGQEREVRSHAMRTTHMKMAASLRTGQTLVGRTGLSYNLQRILYERQDDASKMQDTARRIWFAQ